MDTINGNKREEAIQKAFKLGFEGEKNRQSCSQASFNAISEVLGFKNELVFKCLSALEGGGADTGQCSCGAFSGALVAISYNFGRPYELWEKGVTYIKSARLGQKLYNKFRKEYGSAICKEIQMVKFGRTFNFMEKVDFKAFEDMGGHENICTTIVGLASAWTIDILWDEISKDKDLSKYNSMEEALQNFKAKKD